MMSAKEMKIGTKSLGKRPFNQDTVTLKLQKGGNLLDFAVIGPELFAVYEYEINSDREDTVLYYVIGEGEEADMPKQAVWVKSISTQGAYAGQAAILHIFRDRSAD